MRFVLAMTIPWLLALAAPVQAESCASGPALAAATNAASFETLEWAPFGRAERGWAVYAPRISVEIGTRCPPMTPGFAAALARWQGAHKLPATGALDKPGFREMKTRWTLLRPIVLASRKGCPEAPPLDRLAAARPEQSYGGKTIQLRADALAAYRALAAAARRELPGHDARWFRIFSGFRDPMSDEIRCAVENNCQGVTRATCSAHRTGLALDMNVGQAPGFGPDSSADANRRFMVRTLAYRWLLTNARRFGFVNYVFEPWHWEWSPASTRARRGGKKPG